MRVVLVVVSCPPLPSIGRRTRGDHMPGVRGVIGTGTVGGIRRRCRSPITPPVLCAERGTRRSSAGRLSSVRRIVVIRRESEPRERYERREPRRGSANGAEMRSCIPPVGRGASSFVVIAASNRHVTLDSTQQNARHIASSRSTASRLNSVMRCSRSRAAARSAAGPIRAKGAGWLITTTPVVPAMAGTRKPAAGAFGAFFVGAATSPSACSMTTRLVFAPPQSM